MTANTTQFVELGDEVKDNITGFVGIVVSVTEYIHSCRRVQVMPEVSQDGSFRDERFFDEPQLEVVTRGAYTSPIPKNSVTGGDRPDTPNRK